MLLDAAASFIAIPMQSSFVQHNRREEEEERA
jgi:hypothetical protein